MTGPSVSSIEERLLGPQNASTLEGRVACAISLLVCAGSAVSLVLNVLFTTMEQACLSAIGVIIGGALYIYLRKTEKWRSLALPGCLAFLAIVSFAWATDTGSYSTSGYFFFMMATIASVLLRRRYMAPFVTLTALTIGTLLIREHFFPLPLHLDPVSRHHRLADTALTLSLCIGIIATMLRIVIRQHSRDKEDIRQATTEIKTLRGMLPICSMCKKIRDRAGYWNRIEEYIINHSAAEFSHGFCPDCLADLYGEYGLAPGPQATAPSPPVTMPAQSYSRSTALAYAVPHPLEELLLGNLRTTPLEARIFNAITLIIFLISSATTFIEVLMAQFSAVCTTVVATVLSGALYLHIRKTHRWEPYLLPAAIAFLWLISIDWVLDPAGSFGNDAYYFIFAASVMPLALRQRHKTPFVIISIAVIAAILAKERVYPAIVSLDLASRNGHLLDIASALLLCLLGLFTTVRIVIREHVRDKCRLIAALEEIKVLRGLLPICAKCKKIRDRTGYWNMIEEYMASHSEAEFSECLCPDCLKKTLATSKFAAQAHKVKEAGSVVG